MKIQIELRKVLFQKAIERLLQLELLIFIRNSQKVNSNNNNNNDKTENKKTFKRERGKNSSPQMCICL